jgi:hypothetical protein
MHALIISPFIENCNCTRQTRYLFPQKLMVALRVLYTGRSYENQMFANVISLEPFCEMIPATYHRNYTWTEEDFIRTCFVIL